MSLHLAAQIHLHATITPMLLRMMVVVRMSLIAQETVVVELLKIARVSVKV